MNDIKLSELIAPHYYELHRDIKRHGHTEYTLSGGRGSTKSSVVAIETVLLLKKNPDMHALICRQVKDTLKDSVYTQLTWAIDTLGLNGEFKYKTSPLEIIRKSTGQHIYFRGADDPYKLKSVKTPFGYIGILWFEELDQFRGEAEIRSIEQSVMRGGNTYYEFKTFNPPASKSNWANKYILQNKPDMLTHHSTYLTVPQEWLGRRFFDEAEFLRSVNEKAYRHEYLGEAVGAGGNVFENIELREISDSEIQAFDRIYTGIDWGWFPDPFHWSKMHYDAGRRTLYIFDEYRANKKGNFETAQALRNEKGVSDNDLITADSAERKSVADYRSYGLNCRSAIKGPGSVEYSMKWLASLNKIIIDKRRAPYTAREFCEYEYERTRNGDIVSSYPDRNNHAIDSVRYALESIWKRKGE